MTESLKKIREALELLGKRKCKLIVRENEDTRATVLIDDLPLASFYAGETWDCGFEAREALTLLDTLPTFEEELIKRAADQTADKYVALYKQRLKHGDEAEYCEEIFDAGNLYDACVECANLLRERLGLGE